MKFHAPTAAEQRVRLLARALADLNRLPIDQTANLMLPRQYASCLISSRAELIIAPYAPPALGMEQAAREIAKLCCSDVIGITLGIGAGNVETPYFGVVRDVRAREWCGGYPSGSPASLRRSNSDAVPPVRPLRHPGERPYEALLTALLPLARPPFAPRILRNPKPAQGRGPSALTKEEGWERSVAAFADESAVRAAMEIRHQSPWLNKAEMRDGGLENTRKSPLHAEKRRSKSEEEAISTETPTSLPGGEFARFLEQRRDTDRADRVQHGADRNVVAKYQREKGPSR
ncbi:MAG: hypothetical protein KGJ57_22950 [Sphingomonadales bacterium]|nr:hypothetical protein [Sphingomonadales bacterium]MDE2172245.1 hypothetical protein [Sphingomonadales bacterium]